MRWELVPDVEPLLPRLLESGGDLVKRSPMTCVRRCAVEGRVFYVKRYQHANRWWWPFKYFFQSPRSRREWQLAPKLEALGVSIVPHLAHGERWSARGLLESVLITEGVGDYASLEVVRGLCGEQVQGALGTFLKDLHQRGVWPMDINEHNLLYSATECAFRLVDLDKIRLRDTPIKREQRVQNLVRLARTVPLTHAFFQSYEEGFGEIAGEIRRRAAAMRRALGQRRSHRCWQQNLDFAAQRAGRLRWQVRQQFSGEERLQRVLRDPEGFFTTSRILKSGRSAVVAAADGLVLKRYHGRRPSRLLKDFFRRSRAFRAFRKAYHLELSGIPTARPFAAGSVRVCGLLLRSYLVMEEIRDAREWTEGKADRDEMLRRAAELLAQLHREGFSHRDLKASNLLADGLGRLFLIDLEGLRYLGTVSEEVAAGEAGRLSAELQLSEAERERFLKWYRDAREE